MAAAAVLNEREAMNKFRTWMLVGVAVGLLAFIVVFERHRPSAAERHLPPPLCGDLESGGIDYVRLEWPAGPIMEAARTNGEWRLLAPAYPANGTAIEAFVQAMTESRTIATIPAHEAVGQGARSFGLEPGRATVHLRSGTNRLALRVGQAAPFTNQVYARFEASTDVLVASARFVELLPKTADDWRSRALGELDALVFDRIQVRSGTRQFEIERNPTNKLWQIAKPIPARADQERVENLLRELRNARVKRFLPGDTAADLERFGLNSPAAELALLTGTNPVFRLQLGLASTNQPGEVAARLGLATNLVTLEPGWIEWLGQSYKTFHDPRLFTFLPDAVDRISVVAGEAFTLQRQGSSVWSIVEPATNRADTLLVNAFLANLRAIQIADLARELPSATDLASLGFMRPLAVYSVFEKQTNSAGITTNIPFTEVMVSTNVIVAANDDRLLHVRRADETPVYLTRATEVLALPRFALQVRDRKIWEIDPNAVTSLTITTNGQTQSLARAAAGAWSPDAIQNAAIEDLIFRLAHLQAIEWSGFGRQRLAPFGISEAGLSVTLNLAELPAGLTPTIQFGNSSPRGHIYASVVLPGESDAVIFEFLGGTYHQLLQVLPPRP